MIRYLRKYSLLALFILIAGTFRVWADYALTQGAGTTFAAKSISTVLYPATLTCDATAGETTCAAVKAASTPAAATDPAMVVSVSPNSPVTVVQPSGASLNTTVSGTVTANLGTIAGAATSANQPTAAPASGSATSGQTGNLAMAAVTTGSPTYTTGQTNAMSLDTAGNLRVNVVAGGAGGGAVTGAVNSFVDGWNITEGTKADTALSGALPQTVSIVSILKGIYSGVNGPIPAGSASIGTVGINTGANTIGNVNLNAGTNVVGFTSNDPCTQATKQNFPISQATTTQIIAGTSAKKTYICSISIIGGTGGETFNIVEGTGTLCATGIAAVLGSTTTANGLAIPANGGLTFGNGGASVAVAGNANADNVCITQVGTTRLAGNITYVQQ